MLIIIDGYNFIFTVPALEKHVGINRIESVRDYIISLFSKYKEEKHYDVIVVFDGTCTQTTLPKRQTCAGITVIYSRYGINADTEIKNITDLCKNPRDVHIVTYDNDIKRHVRKCGCHIVEPKAMYQEILGTLNKGADNPSGEPEGKREGPSEEDARYWKDIFINLPGEEVKPSPVKTEIPGTKGKKKSSHTMTEPRYKYQETSADETAYWIRVFKESEKHEHQD
ncbi:MAG: NYN domain-containing protein [Planctomycetia bacterium]|nr:NYN domain-containing protein [Planctomycetia bacterium]